MTSWRAPLSALLGLILLTTTFLNPAAVRASDLPLATAQLAPEATVPTSAAAEAPRLAVIRDGYALLLDWYVQPLSPSDLLNAGYTGLVSALTDAGVRVKEPGPLKLEGDREAAWARFEAGLNQLLADSLAPEELDVTAVVLASMTRWIDEQHTAYLTAEQYRQFLALARGDLRYAGIGMRPSRPGVTVAEVFPDTPAARAGLAVGDSIIAVDGEPTAGKTLEEVARMVRGPEGTPVALEVQRRGVDAPFTLVIVRELIKIQLISTSIVNDNVAYVQLRSFMDEAAVRQFEDFLDALPSRRVRGLVIDLRGNSGGRVDLGERLLNRFLTSAPLYGYQERERPASIRYATGWGRGRSEPVAELVDNWIWLAGQPASGAPTRPLPVAVLIDEGTASMGEIFASAMRDNGRAVLIGKQTAGSVAAARLFPLRDGSAIQITLAEITSGQGERINRIGVAPDLALENSPEDLELGRDKPLETAIAHIWEASVR